jgi:hypothetical protein
MSSSDKPNLKEIQEKIAKLKKQNFKGNNQSFKKVSSFKSIEFHGSRHRG